MNKLVNVLVIDDVEDDARSVMESLRSGGFDVTHRCVRGAAEFESALANELWDAVIAELETPGFPGIEALKVFLAADLDIPFILMSKTFVEDIAITGIKAGASDYITRDRLARLAPVMARELAETRSRATHRKARRDLIESEERFRSLTALSSDWYWEQDEQLRFTYVSAGLRDKYSEALESWAGKTRWELPYRDADWANHRATVEARRPFYEVELRPFRHDGSIVYVSVSGEPKLNAEGRFLGYRGVGRDITEHVRDKIECKESEGKIRRLNRLYAMVSATNALVMRVRERDELFRNSCRIAVEHGEFEMAWIGVVDHSETRIVPMASAGVDDKTMATIKCLFSTNEGTLQGGTLAARAIREKAAVVSNDVENDDRLLFGKMHADSGVRSIAMLPLIVADKAIGVYVLYTHKLEFFDSAGLILLTELAGNVAFAIDHIEKQERLDHFAYYDAITGLANRSLFLDRLAQHMLSAASSGHKLALFLIDLERFKKINDTLGRPAGDALLRLVATWLTENLGDVNALARVDADHFAVVLPAVTHEADVVRLLEKTIGAFLNHSFQLDGVAYRIAAKVGVALFPGDGADADTLFKNAEAAVKKAKMAGDRYLFYADKMTETVAGSLGLENRLRQALERDEFVLHYQAKINIASGELTGAEALLRWNDPQTGLVPPARFIPILEETGLIQEVGRWALGKALEDYQRWRRTGLPAVRIAVNVSPLQLRSRSFVTEIERAIGGEPNGACGLELELTESVIMENVTHNIVSLRAIRALGVTIAIDDFGTGFSSLSYLSKLPLDTLKVDRSFVTDMVASGEGLTLVAVIINLAHALKLKVVAEGVETEEQLRELKLLGCDEMQGFLFGKPIPAAQFEAKYLSRPAGSENQLLPATSID